MQKKRNESVSITDRRFRWLARCVKPKSENWLLGCRIRCPSHSKTVALYLRSPIEQTTLNRQQQQYKMTQQLQQHIYWLRLNFILLLFPSKIVVHVYKYYDPNIQTLLSRPSSLTFSPSTNIKKKTDLFYSLAINIGEIQK